MIKRKFLYRNGLANQLSTVGFSLLVIFLSMLLGSCDSDFMSEDNGSSDTELVVLEFSTSIEKLSLNSNTRAIGSRGVIEGNNFPQGTSEMGMFITRNAGVDDVFPGSADNMKVTLTRNAQGDSWTYAQKDGTPTTPVAYKGKYIQLVAYWPYNVDATASGIPFDFTNVSSVGQTELLYIKPENQRFKIASGRLAARFAHAYSRIVLNIRKSVNSGTIRVSSASIINQSGTWIKNKGMINPATGYPTDEAQSGDITDATEKVLTMTASDTKYEFLVPAFMNELVVDGNIGIKLVVDGKETIFELKREHLNGWLLTSTNTLEYGFRQGYMNTYELVYDNLTMSLQLRDWTTVKPEGDFGLPGIVDTNYKGWSFDCNDISEPIPSTPPRTDHLYETYLTDLERENNGLLQAVWIPEQGFAWVWQQEPPRSPIDFAMSDVLAVPVQWKNQDGVMIAKQLCKNYREGGHSNWRLPRMAEWYMFMKRIKTSNDNEYLYYPQKYGGNIPSENWYWSGTESAKASGNEVQVIKLSIFPTDIGIIGNTLSPTSMALVRCVRDVDPVIK